MHFYVPKESSSRKGTKRRFQPKKGTTQPCQPSVNVDHEKSLRNCLCDGINIYIYIYYDGSQYMKYLMINIDELQVMKLL